jgi:hypothetical protein
MTVDKVNRYEFRSLFYIRIQIQLTKQYRLQLRILHEYQRRRPIKMIRVFASKFEPRIERFALDPQYFIGDAYIK